VGEDRLEPLRQDPDLFVRIAANAQVVAEELRRDYFESTLGIAAAMREDFRSGENGYRIAPIPDGCTEPWAVAFVDGGLSRVDVGFDLALMVRAGIFRVKEGERDHAVRETFGHFPLFLGQLRGGLKASSEYGNVVRHLVELGALVTALEDERFADIKLLMLHGPLQFVSGPFFGHWFFEEDYLEMLGGPDRPHVQGLVHDFQGWCQRCPLADSARCREDVESKHLPAVCMMAYLQHRVFESSSFRGVLLCGAIERPRGRSITRHVVQRLLATRPDLLDRLLDVLEIRERATNTQVEAILDATRYRDSTLLALALDKGECIDWYPLERQHRPDDPRMQLFPRVQSAFLRVAAARYPMRIEAPMGLSADALSSIMCRSNDYANLLPNYAFPIGLDIVDKYAAIPSWMSKAYKHLILAQYGRLLAGEYFDISDVTALKQMVLEGMEHDGRKRPEVE
jgi:hypothetical protein